MGNCPAQGEQGDGERTRAWRSAVGRVPVERIRDAITIGVVLSVTRWQRFRVRAALDSGQQVIAAYSLSLMAGVGSLSCR